MFDTYQSAKLDRVEIWFMTHTKLATQKDIVACVTMTAEEAIEFLSNYVNEKENPLAPVVIGNEDGDKCKKALVI